MSQQPDLGKFIGDEEEGAAVLDAFRRASALPAGPEAKSLTWAGQQARLLAGWHRAKGNFFADCQRDERGHCKPGGGKPDEPGGKKPPAAKPTKEEKAAGKKAVAAMQAAAKTASEAHTTHAVFEAVARVAAKKETKRPKLPPKAEEKYHKSVMGSFSSLVGNENERRLAAALDHGATRLDDSEPADVVIDSGSGPVVGLECKTMLVNASGDIHMDADQRRRKEKWEEGFNRGLKAKRSKRDLGYDPARGRRLDVLVIDQRHAVSGMVGGGNAAEFDARPLEHLYYARGAQKWNVSEMIHVEGAAAVRKLASMSDAEYKEVWREYAGKSYPSRKPHPKVTPTTASHVAGWLAARAKETLA